MPITEGSQEQDLRYDPITRAFVPESITAEVQTCAILPGLGGRYGFQLNELPLKETPSSVTVTRVSDSLVFTEIDTGAPTGTQFYVDYHYDTFSNTGYIILPAAQDGNSFEVAYQGLGSVMSVKNTLFIELAALNSKVSRDGSLAMTGNLNMGSQKIVSLANGTASSDAVNKGQLDTVGNTVNNLQVLKGGKEYSTSGVVTTIDDKYIYEYLSDGGTALSLNITGCPNTSGTIIFISWFGYTTNTSISIHGTNIFNNPTASGGIFAYNEGGTWKGTNP